jgi:hypothetical protein
LKGTFYIALFHFIIGALIYLIIGKLNWLRESDWGIWITVIAAWPVSHLTLVGVIRTFWVFLEFQQQNFPTPFDLLMIAITTLSDGR